MMNQQLSPKDERIVSANPSPDAAIIGPSRGVRDQPGPSDSMMDNNAVYSVNPYGSLDQTYYYGGYGTGAGNWGGYPQYPGVDGLQVVPPMAYGQYSPVNTPVPPVIVDNQIFPPQQMFAPPYYTQTVETSLPPISAAVPVSQAELLAPKGHHSVNSGNMTGFYNLPGLYGSGEPLSSMPASTDMARRNVSPFTSSSMYMQPVGTFGSYDPSYGQITQQRPLPGFGFVPNFVPGQYPYVSSHQNTGFGSLPTSQPGALYRNRLSLEKGRNQRDQDIFGNASDRNRGPRASKIKGKSTLENTSLSSAGKIIASASGINLDSYNSQDFPTDYENAKFFVIKSFSEDNVHRSIKYSVWSSTPHGNRKLDAAYHEAKEKTNCPVFLLFSVNASAQFCGVAEMIGPVDFERNADHWQQDRWSGQFPVHWHIIKDVPNSKFRHILLENNDNKPVTHSRDSQEVKLEHGIEMLKIFKDHDAQTSLLDDFEYYDDRERMLQERKRQQSAKPLPNVSESIGEEFINNISDRLDQALHLEENRELVADEKVDGERQT